MVSSHFCPCPSDEVYSLHCVWEELSQNTLGCNPGLEVLFTQEVALVPLTALVCWDGCLGAACAARVTGYLFFSVTSSDFLLLTTNSNFIRHYVSQACKLKG